MKGSAVLALAVILFASAAKAQLPETNRPWHYQLIEGSFLTEDCLLCERPTISVPMRGSFDLFLMSVGPLFTDFAMRNIDFQSGTNQIRGEGTFRFGGQVAVMQDMRLEVEFNLPTKIGRRLDAFRILRSMSPKPRLVWCSTTWISPPRLFARFGFRP
jgi:hypothetical protein